MNVSVMQTVRLKGMVTPEAVAAATGLSEGDAEAALQELASAENVQERNGRFRVTREGRDRLDAALAEERAGVDAANVKAIYDEFIPLNTEFKELAHRWQMRDGEPNDHTDASYDGAVIDDFMAMADRFEPIADRIAEITPRLAPFPSRFTAAREKLAGGDHDWFLKPLIDSYHTVWFELHEELIGLSGLTREQEAKEGRAE